MQDVRVDPSNAAQERAWDGDEGRYWAEHARRFDDTMAGYHRPLLDAAGIGIGDDVLDIGCGTGQTTRDAARIAYRGTALGVDLSTRMIGLARRLAADGGVHNARFLRADAQVHPFAAGSFDVAVSRTGAMFFGDPVAAFTGVGRAIRPGGRLVLLTWQPAERNEWFTAFTAALAGRPITPPPNAPGPFGMSDPGRVRATVYRAGFRSVTEVGMTEPMCFGPDPDSAHDLVLGLLGWMLQGLDDAGRARAVDALRATLEAHHTPHGVLFDSAAWLVTARRP
jgi:SAM-dependent methyltransferase